MKKGSVEESSARRSSDRELRVYPPIHRIGYGGVWLRQQLLKGILSGSPVLMGIQRLRFPLLNTLMSAVSFLGEEEFYTLLVPLVMWVWDARLGALLALLMAMAFYCTGFLKNLLCLPRPPVPPVVPLQESQDWSLPSHHALLSVNIPWYIWFYLSVHSPLPPLPSAFLFSAIALWSFLVMFSRMYLGVHSPADILTGGIVGCLLLASWLQVDLTVDGVITESGPDVIVVFCSVAMVMLYLHPDPLPTTIIYDETTSLVGVALGVVIGRALGPAHVMTALLEVKSSRVWWWVVLCGVLRYVVGLVTLGLVRTVVKAGATQLFTHLCQLASIPCVCQKRVSQVTYLKIHYSHNFKALDKAPAQPSPSKPFMWSQERPLNIQTAVRLMTYGSMGLVVVVLAPYLFTLLAL